jgi:hypothetical protein
MFEQINKTFVKIGQVLLKFISYKHKDKNVIKYLQ